MTISRRMVVVSVLVAMTAVCGALPQDGGQSLSELIKGATTRRPGGPAPAPPSTQTQSPAAAGIPHQDRPSGSMAQGDCECVPYYLCQNDSIITDGVGLIDIRSGLDSLSIRLSRSAEHPGIQDGPCENYLDVCCKKPQTVDRPITPTPHIRSGCGRRNPEGVGFRITGNNDNEAQFGEFPWMVAILREESVNGNPEKLNVYQCGGSLIHREVVLTAAHCVAGKDVNQMKIRAGEWDTQTKNEIYPHQDRRVKEIIVHENYHAGALYNDVALLLLQEPVDLAENVDVVCLPDRNTVVNSSHCFASGWGKDVFGKEGKYQVILKKVELPIVQHHTCQEALRRTRLGPYYKLDKSFICAGGLAGRDTCKGDGGSPLVCPRPNDPATYEQAGIVAWGIGCGEDGTPGIYANVAGLRNWIDEQMVYNGLDVNSYVP
ncbi:phenoloxidase-activating factor 2 [Schistocerca piceifrons]|uniref:phenoloxidase-activating factor 2 n=1 Tax=Schistocerca piceifrons TaxID=274613 RepID=UPI001F5ED864|nr:phenoloxidase-activating factor 2 [Schistocerca piceifrons]